MSNDSIHAPERTPELTPLISTQTQAFLEGLRKHLHNMPLPGTPGALYFDGKQATDFLQCYELMFREFDEPEGTVVKKLSLYCYGQIGATVEYLVGYEAGCWKDIKAEVLEEFRAQISKQHMYTVRFLEELTSAQKVRTGDIRQFVRTSTAVSTKLRRMEVLSEYQEVQLFLGGRHLSLARKLVTKIKLDVNTPESFNG
jgi:hypothetical protein